MAVPSRPELTPARRRPIRRTIAALAAVVAGAAALAAAPSSPALAWGRTPPGPSCGLTTYKSNGTPWTCTFADNFSDNSLDPSLWTVTTSASTGFYVGQTCLTADNVVESNGELRITTKDTGTPFTCTTPYGSFTTHYTGGHVSTLGHFAQTYGKFEVRARDPKSASGLHSAFWLSPVKQTYGAWPASGEIDVSEWWSNAPTYSLPTLHYTGSTAADSGTGCTVADPTIWHTYTVVWLPTQMQFSIDGKTCFTDTWTPTAPLTLPAPFDQPFSMALTMAAGGSTGANAASTLTSFPGTYEVDYVKAWK